MNGNSSENPETIAAAVAKVLTWEWANDRESVDLIRVLSDTELTELHFSLGMAMRNELGLWSAESPLLKASGVEHPDDASSVILIALRDHLQNTATAEDTERSRIAYENWKEAKERRSDEMAAKDANLTSRRCPRCRRPCPTYRRTCRYCGLLVGRETGGR